MSENSDGFTFVEMTIVLSIAFALSVIILPIGYKMTKHQIERDAIDLLINTIYTMQSYAMGHEQYTILRFITDTEVTTYQVVTPNQKVLIERELPKGMTIAGSSPMKTVEFHPNGDILKGGVLIIVTNDSRVSMTFQFQRGRMIIRESERVFLDRGLIHVNNCHDNIWYTATNRKFHDTKIT